MSFWNSVGVPDGLLSGNAELARMLAHGPIY